MSSTKTVKFYLKRNYRNISFNNNLSGYEVKYKESDLFILTDKIYSNEALATLKNIRFQIEKYSEKYPDFIKKMLPIECSDEMPEIIKNMVISSKKAGVGPMASIAGAIAEGVGNNLIKYSEEVIIENGGDIFLKINRERKSAIFAGNSPLSMKIGINLKPYSKPYGLCTSSGTVGHSVSYGNADAVVCIAESAPLADACATAIGNVVINHNDIDKGLEFFGKINGLWGCVIIYGNKIGAVGDVEMCKINEVKHEK